MIISENKVKGGMVMSAGAVIRSNTVIITPNTSTIEAKNLLLPSFPD